MHRHNIVLFSVSVYYFACAYCILFVCHLCLYVTSAGGAVVCDSLQRLCVLPLQVTK
jgi:hypothetical protein